MKNIKLTYKQWEDIKKSVTAIFSEETISKWTADVLQKSQNNELSEEESMLMKIDYASLFKAEVTNEDLSKSVYYFHTEARDKMLSDVIEKGRKGLPVGTERQFGGKMYVKQANGWKPKAKQDGKTEEKEETGKKEVEALTEEEYLNKYGATFMAGSESALHHNIKDDKNKQKHIEISSERMKDNNKKREELREEYKKKIESGEIRKPTRREELERIASGHEDNEATQAAKRLLAKMDKKESESKKKESDEKVGEFTKTDGRDSTEKLMGEWKSTQKPSESYKVLKEYLDGDELDEEDRWFDIEEDGEGRKFATTGTSDLDYYIEILK